MLNIHVNLTSLLPNSKLINIYESLLINVCLFTNKIDHNLSGNKNDKE